MYRCSPEMFTEYRIGHFTITNYYSHSHFHSHLKP